MAGPLGYTLSTPNANLQEIFAESRMADKSVTLVKSVIQGYLESFLNPEGENRKFLTSSMSPVGLQFVTDLAYDDDMKTKPNLRKTYLARFFAENIGRLPSVLLIDTGTEIVKPGINELVKTDKKMDGRWIGYMTSLLKVSMSITVASLSEEDTGTLSTLISMMFNPLPSVINKYILRDPESFWEVRLPLAGLNLGQASSMNIEGDTKTTVWTKSLELACDFENHIGIEMPMDTYVMREPTYNQNGRPMPRFLNLVPNQGIPLGMAYPLYIEDMLTDYFLGVADPSVALVTSEPPYLLQPKKQGATLLLVQDRAGKDRHLTDIAFRVVR